MMASRNECSYVIRPSPLLVQTWSLPMGFKRLGSPRSSGFLLRFWLSKLTLKLLYAAQAWDCGPCASWTSPAANLSCLSIAHGDRSRFKIIQMINAQIAWQSMASSAEMADRLSKPCIFSEADISGMVEAKSLLMLTYLHFQPADGWATTCTRSPKTKHEQNMTLQSPMCFCVLHGLILSTLWRMQSHVLGCLRPEDLQRKTHIKLS